MRPCGGRGQAADDQALLGAVEVASNPGRWDPARLVVEVVAGADADVAEVARAHMGDRGSTPRAGTVALGPGRSVGVAGMVQRPYADQGALPFVRAGRVAVSTVAGPVGG